MLIVFASDARVRYKQDAINCTAYPPGHAICFTYDAAHVDPAILRNMPLRDQSYPFHDQVVIVYAEKVHTGDECEFRFLPLRFGSAYTVSRRGSRICIASSVAGFPKYKRGEGTEPGTHAWFHQAIAAIPNRPRPGIADNHGSGFFALLVTGAQGNDLRQMTATQNTDDHSNWESVVECLATTKAFSKSFFYRVTDIEESHSDANWRTLRSRWRRLSSSRLGTQSEYGLSPGVHAILLCSVLNPSSDTPLGALITFTTSGEGLGGVWPDTIPIDSRRNEWEVVLSAKRVLDRSPGVLTITDKGVEEIGVIRSPQIVLLFSIRLSTATALGILVCFLVGSLLLALPQEDLHDVCEYLLGKPTTYTPWWRRSTLLYTLSRVAGAVCTAIGAYVAFRKLPVKS